MGAVQRDRDHLELASEAVLAVVAVSVQTAVLPLWVVAVIVAALAVGLLACLIIHVGGSLAEMQGLGWVP